jgi:hypothetical protein
MPRLRMGGNIPPHPQQVKALCLVKYRISLHGAVLNYARENFILTSLYVLGLMLASDKSFLTGL